MHTLCALLRRLVAATVADARRAGNPSKCPTPVIVKLRAWAAGRRREDEARRGVVGGHCKRMLTNSGSPVSCRAGLF
ncbi:hypothetical protein QBC34DRAFT_395866 [Podospora aff. communis PSN243]|uniref:Secreted protein n=1 Tax=Podospora aff. communis PSN243 TaxID=3040156 RepID=A0AAV9H3L8_9PEZI|nr:hypothetical protein QBC34DRAFT_395866 [Podospora aff. communis PSN243]